MLASDGAGVDGVGVLGPRSGPGLRITTTHGSTPTIRRPLWRIRILRNRKAMDLGTASFVSLTWEIGLSRTPPRSEAAQPESPRGMPHMASPLRDVRFRESYTNMLSINRVVPT